MANIFRWLIEAINPCVHQWATVETLKDRPENPTAVRLVQECPICGEVRQMDFAAPETNGECKHKWQTVHTANVFAAGTQNSQTEEELPIYVRHTQRCEHCGDLRKVDIR